MFFNFENCSIQTGIIIFNTNLCYKFNLFINIKVIKKTQQTITNINILYNINKKIIIIMKYKKMK